MPSLTCTASPLGGEAIYRYIYGVRHAEELVPLARTGHVGPYTASQPRHLLARAPLLGIVDVTADVELRPQAGDQLVDTT